MKVDMSAEISPMLLLLLRVFLFFLITTPAGAAAPSSGSLAKCPTKCGNITIPYPFGTVDGCYDHGLQMSCSLDDSDSPRLLITGTRSPELEVTDLSLDTIKIKSVIAWHCDNDNRTQTRDSRGLYGNQAMINLNGLPYTLSRTRNRFFVIGCDTLALVTFNSSVGQGGCSTICADKSQVMNGTCDGYGCCQVGVTKGVKWLLYTVSMVDNSSTGTSHAISPCGYAFVADQQEFVFQMTDLLGFARRSTVAAVLDWSVGIRSCAEEEKNLLGDYACGNHSRCVDSSNGPGYKCLCDSGYQGNPYLADGCQDIDECGDPQTNPCSDICTNTIGSFICSCPTSAYGDGKNVGKGCIKLPKKLPVLQLVLGLCLGFFFLLISVSWIHWALMKRRMLKMKEKFFEQNGGLLLQQQLALHEGKVESARIFTTEELKHATNNYNESLILGQGGNGTVYKGLLQNKREVAIKKSKAVDDTMQMEQFINEIVILSQVIHRNVVKILGCCLETKVPMLVYEFVPNGTLFHHLHHEERHSSLSWRTRLRIAEETGGAIAYLHSYAARPIFHRDIKSTNILLDHKYTAKVADFGASRMVSLNQLHLTTLVIGTRGYLDPEYFLTGQLTAESDVYSFGVILAELLTGEEPVSFLRSQEERNLAVYFTKAIEEGRLYDIIEDMVKVEGDTKEIQRVAELALQCLKMKGVQRPKMMEVVAELDHVRRRQKEVDDGREVVAKGSDSYYYSSIEVSNGSSSGQFYDTTSDGYSYTIQSSQSAR